ncbi:MAG: Asp23/Gls24 family envelope stress response protein [Kineothrix sp.]|nr:Asp23/Gls24 family envelope stress response protein [Kineothrix sp.]
MEKELDRNGYVSEEEGNSGSVKIADDVVAMIAGIAATEVDGVAAMAGNITHEIMSKVGVKSLKKGVKVDVIGKSVRVDLALVMEYGYNIPAASQKVQEKVKSAIENMTGLDVLDVNIRIAGINMQKDR